MDAKVCPRGTKQIGNKCVKGFEKRAKFERGSRFGMNVVHGEAGTGVYAYVPSKRMWEYYTKAGEKLMKITPKEGTAIVDLTKELDGLIAFVKKDIDNLAKTMKYYIKPKVNKQNIQRFGSSIEMYIGEYHPNVSAYILPHRGPGIPTGKQVVITRPENFYNWEVT